MALVAFSFSESSINRMVEELGRKLPQKVLRKMMIPALTEVGAGVRDRMKAALPEAVPHHKRKVKSRPATSAIGSARPTLRGRAARLKVGFRVKRGVNSAHNFREFGALRYKGKRHGSRKGLRKGFWKAWSRANKGAIESAVAFKIRRLASEVL